MSSSRGSFPCSPQHRDPLQTAPLHAVRPPRAALLANGVPLAVVLVPLPATSVRGIGLRASWACRPSARTRSMGRMRNSAGRVPRRQCPFHAVPSPVLLSTEIPRRRQPLLLSSAPQRPLAVPIVPLATTGVHSVGLRASWACRLSARTRSMGRMRSSADHVPRRRRVALHRPRPSPTASLSRGLSLSFSLTPGSSLICC